jgi:hypothetical protein
MNDFEREINYLCVEANHVYNFIKTVRESSQGEVVVIPNLSYGLTAITPVIHLLRREKFRLFFSKVGSSDAHNKSTVLVNSCFPLEVLTDPNLSRVVVIDGTKNVNNYGNSANFKYPDSQQGYLNYTILINDLIGGGNIPEPFDLLGVSNNHLDELRQSSGYNLELSRISSQTATSLRKSSPFMFRYWNPSGLELFLYNHGDNCREKVNSVTEEELKEIKNPAIIFVNSVIPGENHSIANRESWGFHQSAYFDDDGDAKRFKAVYDNFGIYIGGGIEEAARKAYEKLYGK